MAQARWKVDASNFGPAWQYLYRNRSDLLLILPNIVKPQQLQALLLEELTPSEVTRLRTSIRVDKARNKKALLGVKDIQVTISPEAHNILAQLSNTRDVVYSEAIERYMGALINMPYAQAEAIADEWS